MPTPLEPGRTLFPQIWLEDLFRSTSKLRPIHHLQESFLTGVLTRIQPILELVPFAF